MSTPWWVETKMHGEAFETLRIQLASTDAPAGAKDKRSELLLASYQAYENERKRKKKTKDSGACLRFCGANALSCVFQCLCSLVCVLVGFYGAFLALSVVNIVGVTSVPPGLKFARFYGESGAPPPSPPPPF